MTLNESIHYENDCLYCDSIPISEIAETTGTPVYIYSIKRALANLRRLQDAFAGFNAHIHYSAKANANRYLLHKLNQNGAGIDAVSGGEIYRALQAGVNPQDIVFAGVGKTKHEIRYALEQGIGWLNIENIDECEIANRIAGESGHRAARIALRFNPDVTAHTHPSIATGHSGAKFGLPAEHIRHILDHPSVYPNLNFAGIHIHIGSQLNDTNATQKALRKTLNLIAPYSNIRTINIGGGFPVAYQTGEQMPSFADFAALLKPVAKDYEILLEPGRSIVADAGILVAQILYRKEQSGQNFLIIDAGMTELIRPALYCAYHEIIPLRRKNSLSRLTQVMGPVCETTDVIGKNVMLPELQPEDDIAILTTGAYGMTMAGNYNMRPRPPEAIVTEDGNSWQVTTKRQRWQDI